MRVELGSSRNCSEDLTVHKTDEVDTDEETGDYYSKEGLFMRIVLVSEMR